MVAEEFSRNADQGNIAVEHGNGEPGPHAIRVLIDEIGNELREKSGRVTRAHARIGQVSTRSELEPVFLYYQRRFGHLGGRETRGQFDHFASERLPKALVAAVGSRIDGLATSRTLHENC